MSLNGRLGRLERAAGLTPDEPCPVCRIEIVEARPGEDLPQAAPCTRPAGCPYGVRRLVAVAPEEEPHVA